RFDRLAFRSFLLRRPPTSPLFPYTTLFRSRSSPTLDCVPGSSTPPARSCWSGCPAGTSSPLRSAAVSTRCCREPPPEVSYGYGRSEEHTSELQSRENLVCRLLLEKKNYKNSRYASVITEVSCKAIAKRSLVFSVY